MSQIKVQRKTLTGVSTKFEFDELGLKFLVKNFSDSDCYVNFEPITDNNLNSSILIPSKIAQLVLSNEYDPERTKSIYVKGTGDVEVQIVLW